jgi:hypothetical protein
MAAIDRTIDMAEADAKPLAALMMSPPAFAELKRITPRKQYRKRQGTRFINAYRGIPIELHDEWSWGWMLRAANGTFVHFPREESGVA